MQRRRRREYQDAGYPRPGEVPDRRQVLAGLAALAGGGALAALNWGCVGDILYVDTTLVETTLPPPPEVHMAPLADGMVLRYRVDLVIGDRDLDECLLDTGSSDTGQAAALEAMDAILLSCETGDFADGADLSSIEADLAIALHLACECHEAVHEAVLSLDLVVDSIDTP